MSDLATTSSNLQPAMSVQEIVQKLRKRWSSYPKKFAAIYRNAERLKMPDGRSRTFIRCAKCSGTFPKHMIQANHKQPVGRLESTSEQDIAAYTARMFPPVNGIEPLCLLCHLEVSKQQRKEMK